MVLTPTGVEPADRVGRGRGFSRRDGGEGGRVRLVIGMGMGMGWGIGIGGREERGRGSTLGGVKTALRISQPGGGGLFLRRWRTTGRMRAVNTRGSMVGFSVRSIPHSMVLLAQAAVEVGGERGYPVSFMSPSPGT